MATPHDKAEIIEFLLDKISKQTRLARTEIDPHVPLASYGVDSVYAISLCADLEDWLGISVEPTIAWDYPTIDKIAGFLAEQVRA